MAKKEEKEQPMFSFPMMMMPSQGGSDIEAYLRVQKMLEDEKKKIDEEKKKKAKPEPIKFSFLETFGFAIAFGPLIGFGYYVFLKYAFHKVELLFQ